MEAREPPMSGLPSISVTVSGSDAHLASVTIPVTIAERTRAAVAQLERERADLGVRAFALSGKPFGFAFRRALRALGSEARHTAMVGDQLFTDVLGANCAGMISILVTPLSPGRHAHTRAARQLERWVLKGGGHGRPVDR